MSLIHQNSADKRRRFLEKKVTYFACVVFEVSWECSVETSERHLDMQTQNSGI